MARFEFYWWAIREGIQCHQLGESAFDPIAQQMCLPLEGQSGGKETGRFLDNFSLKELHRIVGKGADGLIKSVLVSVVSATLVLAGSNGTVIWLLLDSMSRSQANQLRQGLVALIVLVARLALSFGLFHLMRIPAAAKMKAEPIDTQNISENNETI